MKVISWDNFLIDNPWKDKEVSITVGVFDGIHSGHQILFKRLQADITAVPLVFTFRVNPAELTRPKTFKGNILTLEQKLERMDKFGVKGVIIIDFSHDFSKLTGSKFFSLIGEKVRLRNVVLGENHRLGYEGETGADEVKEILGKNGIMVFIEKTFLLEGVPVSSTRIRNALLEGQFEKIHGLLESEYTLDFRNTEYKREGTKIRVKRTDCNQILPPDGLYKGNIVKNLELFATNIILDKKYIEWNHSDDIPVEKITICNTD